MCLQPDVPCALRGRAVGLGLESALRIFSLLLQTNNTFCPLSATAVSVSPGKMGRSWNVAHPAALERNTCDGLWEGIRGR